ncbi:MAG: helix-turn-helix domain-containing protein [Candidatus Kapabacteria bacterium]|nr:helix-turn-helix domain-containing protein [Ignavibacteriota bacterium]MCW5886442.1 helix-turn-helix domain-containing protein [Candidatus Kapabacteria bacterium]
MTSLLTARQAYEYLNIHRTTFIRYVNNGIIPSITLAEYQDGKRKVRRFKQDDLDALNTSKAIMPADKPKVRKRRKKLFS